MGAAIDRQISGDGGKIMKCDTIPDLEKFLQIQEQALGAEAAEVATTASKLADLYLKAGQQEMAKELYIRALAIRRNLVGVHKDEIQDSEQSLARLAALQHGPKTQSTSAHPSVDTTIYGAGVTPSTNNTQSSSRITPPAARLKLPAPGETAQMVGRISAGAKVLDAIREAETELELLRHMSGKNHPSVADMLTRIADLYCRTKAYAEMEPFLLEALHIRENSAGPEHPLVSTELKNLARLYIVQERYSVAEPLLKRALSIRQKAYGQAHPRVADLEEQYAIVLRKTNRAYQAEALEKHVQEIRSAHSGENSPVQAKPGISKANC